LTHANTERVKGERGGQNLSAPFARLAIYDGLTHKLIYVVVEAVVEAVNLR